MTTGGPAFPHLHNTCQRVNESEHFEGMTLLDYFAANVAGHIEAEWSRGFAEGSYGEDAATPQEVARHAYEIAAAMLAEKARREGAAQ